MPIPLNWPRAGGKVRFPVNAFTRPIGVFDSGIGGLTVVKQLRRALLREDIVYLGDTARVPYGTKSPETVIRFACEDTGFLVEKGVKAIVVACNTASAWALPELERQFDLPIIGVILPGAGEAVKRTRSGRIGVIGTHATMRSEAYPRAIERLNASAQVYSRACPLLVPLVEEGWINREVTLAVLREYLQPLQRHRIDTLVLGCTHYPLLKPAITKVLGRDVRLVDSAQSCAAFVAAELKRLNLLNPGRGREGTIQPFVTDDTGQFMHLAKRFLGMASRDAVKVDLPPFRAGNTRLPRRSWRPDGRATLPKGDRDLTDRVAVPAWKEVGERAPAGRKRGR